MFFPIRTDRRLARTPWVNYSIIALNVIVYLFTWKQIAAYPQYIAANHSVEQVFRDLPAVGAWLWPDQGKIHLYQFFTYQFLHSAPERVGFLGIYLPLHLIFNMLFLYVFGNAVEDRLGKFGYLCFYLAGGVLAGLGHIYTSQAPVLGASGAIAGVTGAYLALYPLSNVTIAYWLIFFIGSFEVSSVVLILFRVIQDVVFQVGNIGSTAYTAHLSGYLYGFIVGMALLLGRLVPREPYDMLAIIEHRRRRAQFRRLASSGDAPAWEHAAPGDPVKASHAAGAVPSAEDQAVMDRRSAISLAAGQHDMPRAASLYSSLLRDDPEQVMSQTVQLDLANQLMADARYDTAAHAYELFLKTYRYYAQSDHIQLILGLIYARYLARPERARELLTAVRDRLDPTEQQLADQALSEIA